MDPSEAAPTRAQGTVRRAGTAFPAPSGAFPTDFAAKRREPRSPHPFKRQGADFVSRREDDFRLPSARFALRQDTTQSGRSTRAIRVAGYHAWMLAMAWAMRGAALGRAYMRSM